MVRNLWLVVCLAVIALVSGRCCASAVAGDGVDPNGGSATPARLANLRNIWGPPAGTMYSLGGYAPASGCGCNNAEVASPTGCAGIWNGYQARPCGLHRHFADDGSGAGGCNAGGCASGGCASGGCDKCGGLGGLCGCRHGWGGCGGGWGGGPIVTGALGCGCAPVATCNPCKRHHCPLFGHCKRKAVCCDGETAACGAGSYGGGEVIDGGSNGPMLAPTPGPESIQPAPQPPGPSAERQPRRFRPFTAWKSADKEQG